MKHRVITLLAILAIAVGGSLFAQGRGQGGRGGRPGEGRTPEFPPPTSPYYWRVFETTDEYFDYYRGYHAFWKLYGMGLPDQVLKKLYYKNALRLVPGLPAARFPN
jgi:hypothetical protein